MKVNHAREIKELEVMLAEGTQKRSDLETKLKEREEKFDTVNSEVTELLNENISFSKMLN